MSVRKTRVLIRTRFVRTLKAVTVVNVNLTTEKLEISVKVSVLLAKEVIGKTFMRQFVV